MRRAVGDQHLTVEGAKKAANDAWAGTVRFHLGEKFMDLNNARNIVYTCSRSSIKEGGVHDAGTIAHALRDRGPALSSSARGRGQQQVMLNRID